MLYVDLFINLLSMILEETTCKLNVIDSPCSKFYAALSEIPVKSIESNYNLTSIEYCVDLTDIQVISLL